ncbi:MAG: hypothetical protein ACXVBW_12085 [Bdellovibrionota bacterium]
MKWIAALAAFLSCVNSWAYSFYDRRDDDHPAWFTTHQTTMGGGISSPSDTSSIVENPAGLTYNQDFAIEAQAMTNSWGILPIGAGGHLFLGNSYVGGAVGFSTFNGSGAQGGSVGNIDVGVAGFIPQAYLSIGVSASFLAWNYGNAAPSGFAGQWGMNIGVMGNPQGNIRGGLVAYQVFDGVDAIGAGVAWDPTEWFTVLLDATEGLKAGGTMLAPSIGLNLYNFQLNVGYNWAVVPGYSPLNSGLNAGLGFTIGQNFHMDMFYNHLALIYLGATVKLNIF